MPVPMGVHTPHVGLCALCPAFTGEGSHPCFHWPVKGFGHLKSFLLPFPRLCSEEDQAWEQPDPQRAGRLPGHCTVTDTCCSAAPVTASPGAGGACAVFSSQGRAALPHSLPGARHRMHSSQGRVWSRTWVQHYAGGSIIPGGRLWH